jgi:hypothetical protein
MPPIGHAVASSIPHTRTPPAHLKPSSTPNFQRGGPVPLVTPLAIIHPEAPPKTPAQVILAGRRMNDPMVRHAARPGVRMMRRKGKNVARRTVRMLGVTFKEARSDIHTGKVVVRERELEGWGEREVVSDPRADAGAVQRLLPRCLTPAGQLHGTVRLALAAHERRSEFRTPRAAPQAVTSPPLAAPHPAHLAGPLPARPSSLPIPRLGLPSPTTPTGYFPIVPVPKLPAQTKPPLGWRHPPTGTTTPQAPWGTPLTASPNDSPLEDPGVVVSSPTPPARRF